MAQDEELESRQDRRNFLASALFSASLAAGAVVPRVARADLVRPIRPKPDRVDAGGRFAGKAILITGATTGIGEAAARAFAREGGKVTFCGRRVELGRKIEADIQRFGGTATFVRVDVRNEKEIASLVRTCLDNHGRLDVAYNNAAMFPPRPMPLADYPLEVFDDVWRTNFLGAWFCMRHEIPAMIGSGGGCIINCASIGAHRSFPGITPYTAAKAALVSMSRTAALDYGKQNIRVVSISPGSVDTPMYRSAAGDPAESPPDNAPGRINTVEEIARAVLWLASEEGSFMTGCDVDLTSGQMA